MDRLLRSQYEHTLYLCVCLKLERSLFTDQVDIDYQVAYRVTAAAQVHKDFTAAIYSKTETLIRQKVEIS